jgi:DNA-binding transcriptional ArsR family regulator
MGRQESGAPEGVTVFVALAHPIRLALMMVLMRGERLSITQLTAHTGVSRQATTVHLKLLARAHLVRSLHIGREDNDQPPSVRSIRKGREHLWELHADGLMEAGKLLKAKTHEWAKAADRLRDEG